MDVTRVSESVLSFYEAFASWCFTHQTEVNVLVGGVVLGSLLFLARRTLRMRRLTHRIRWGVGMKRSKNREAFERGLISFGIVDAIEEAIFRGDMTRDRADQWYTSFANDYNMTDLLPRPRTKEEAQEGLKKAINMRIPIWERLKVVIPGLHPKDELKVDKTYQPTNVVLIPLPDAGKRNRPRSKYSKAG